MEAVCVKQKTPKFCASNYVSDLNTSCQNYLVKFVNGTGSCPNNIVLIVKN
jgi:hypothetical protein